MVSKGQFVGLDCNCITQQVMTGTQVLTNSVTLAVTLKHNYQDAANQPPKFFRQVLIIS